MPSNSLLQGLARRIAVARGEEAADVVVRGGRVLSVFTREWLDADVAIVDGWIAGLGRYEGRETVDAAGRFVVPGFIDAHMHLESSKLLPDELARLVVPLGTTTVVADPHEIANVLGTDGVHWLLDLCPGLPLDVWFRASSCVPASHFETPRRPLSPGDLEALLRRRRVLGLAEMMNFPGVIAGAPSELAKLALDNSGRVDGHAPGVLGHRLQAYAAAGIRSDHEARELEEGRERLRAGLWLLIREGSAARNLDALLPLLAEYGPHRIAFCTDDREPEHIAESGHLNGMVRRAVAAGIPAEDALVAASFSAASWHGLPHHGALAPGYQADVLLLPDLERFEPALVLKAGRPVELGERPQVPEWVRNTVRLGALDAAALALPADGQVRVIGVIPGQIVTESLVEDAGAAGLAKVAVFERHLGTGRVGVGLVRGFELARGALASTIAHDAHNVVVVGENDADMIAAVRRLGELGGGIVAVAAGEVLAELPLPIAGLLSDGRLEDVIAAGRACVDASRTLGCTLEAPFQTMAFLALSVIPHLKITDRGLVDVDAFDLVPLEA